MNLNARILKYGFSTLVIISAACLAALAVLYQRQMTATLAAEHAYDVKYQSYLLADELRQSSDDLTRFVRTYAATGDKKYSKWYSDVLSKRNGETARPANPSAIYWDLIVDLNDPEPQQPGKKEALLDAMKAAGFSDTEMKLLGEAKAQSDDLVNLEVKAMGLIEGVVTSAGNEAAATVAPDLEGAQKLLYSHDYHAAKAKVMLPIAQFFNELDQRTQANINLTSSVVDSLSNQIYMVGAALLATLICTGIVFVIMQRQRTKLEAERSILEERRRLDEQERLKNDADREFALTALGGGLKKLAQRDLTYRIDQDVPDAYRALQQDFNAAAQQLKGAITSVLSSSQSINTGTMEISTASDDLSRRTENQAASLEETAAAVAEVTNRVKQTAQGANKARDVVSAAKDEAARSGDVVKRAIEAMTGIESSSHKITQIVGVIDEIAFQTNLLALNAGVEAARAGEAGRGFAVVASEVRALALRSAEAAKEIGSLISLSKTEVARGVKLVNETNTSLSSIIERVLQINSVVQDIADSAQEQATSLQEVNTAVEQMDQTTQQNAAMVEEATAATRTLALRSQDLDAIVNSFITDELTQGGRSREAA